MTSLIFTILIFNTIELKDNWLRFNILGFELGYGKLRISVIEIAYGSLSRGYGIGVGFFEFNYPTFSLLPTTFYIAKPIGKHSIPITGKFGGPVLLPIGCQYPL